MRVRVSIGWLMGVVLMIALDLGFTRCRWMATTEHRFFETFTVDVTLALGMTVPPMLNVLTVIGVLMIRNLLRRGECGPFLSGFFLSGVGAMVLVTTTWAILMDSIFEPLMAVIRQFLEPFIGTMFDQLGTMLSMLLISLVTTVPQLLLALAGGLLNRRFGGFKIVTARGLGRVDAT